MQVHLTRVDVVAVGTLAADVDRLVDDYERRLGKYVRFTAHEVKAEPTARGKTVVLRAESERLATVLDRITSRSADRPTIVALDLRAPAPSTEELREAWLGVPHLVVLIGGTMGLPSEIRARAGAAVSFGRITLPHQLARLVLTEQLYRCFRIARGEPYHF